MYEKILVCPECKNKISVINPVLTFNNRIKFSSIWCDTCGKTVGSIEFGKVNFFLGRTVDKSLPVSSSLLPDTVDFRYQRFGCLDKSISHQSMKHLKPWGNCNYDGCYFGEGNDWSLNIQTDATDLALYCFCHQWSGMINVTINGEEICTIDLYEKEESASNRSFIIYKNLHGPKEIILRPAGKNPASSANQFFFIGYEGCFQGSPSLKMVNRGNGFPAMYSWALEQLPKEALVLDNGAGDRCFGDSRIIAFEYMPEELADVYGDGHKLPFADETFDVVFSQAVIEHLQHPFVAAKEMMRVLKPGGLIYIESAFMQPLHAVPYHYFNTTSWGIEILFQDNHAQTLAIEWFTPLSQSVRWFIEACGGGGLNIGDRYILNKILKKIDRHVSYENLRVVAGGVAYWGLKPGESNTNWKKLMKHEERPTFVY